LFPYYNFCCHSHACVEFISVKAGISITNCCLPGTAPSVNLNSDVWN